MFMFIGMPLVRWTVSFRTWLYETVVCFSPRSESVCLEVMGVERSCQGFGFTDVFYFLCPDSSTFGVLVILEGLSLPGFAKPCPSVVNCLPVRVI